MAKKDEIKEKEIDAPYELPEGWKWCKQNEVCRLTDGEKKTDVSYPYLEVKYLRGNKEKGFVTSGKFIKAGTKVILVDGENSGEVFTVPEDGYMGSTFKALSIQNVDEKYLQFFIQTKKDLYRNNKKGSAIPHLNKDLFFNMPFPLPQNPAEQQRIVNRIETMFAKLDQAQEKAQSVVDNFEPRKAAILHKAFTGELTANWRKENGVSDDSWEEKTIGEAMHLQAGKNISANKISKENNNTNQYPCFGGNGIRGYVDTFNNEGSFPVIGRQGALCGNLNFATGKFYATEHAVVVTCPSAIDSTWAYYTLKSMNLNQYATATAQPGLAVSNIVKLDIFVPSLNEQQEIVRILDTVLEKETRAKEAAQTVLEQIALLKKSILARAFRGEL